jgi:hypothetical protein
MTGKWLYNQQAKAFLPSRLLEDHELRPVQPIPGALPEVQPAVLGESPGTGQALYGWQPAGTRLMPGYDFPEPGDFVLARLLFRRLPNKNAS